MGSDVLIAAPVVAIEPFTPGDYPAIASVLNAVWPEYPETPDELRYQDETRDPKLKWARFVARNAAGEVIGTASYGQSSGMYHPRKFHLDVTVLPEHEGRGLDAALYEYLIGALAPFDPISLRGSAREDRERMRALWEQRGFLEVMREQESRIDLAGFDPAAFASDLERTAATGIVLRTARELHGADPDFFRKCDDLFWAVGQDIPHPEPPTRASHDVFIKRFENPNFLWDGNIIALDGDRYVGTSVLWAAQASPDLFTGTTGVLREYRKRGIATALKVRALTWAKEVRAAPGVRTWNEVGNTGMLGINFRLGFVKKPAWIEYTKTLKDEERAGA